MDDPLPVGEVAPGQHLCELVGPERLERPVVDDDAGERARDRLEQIRLHVGEAGLRRDRGRDPTGDEVHFLYVVVLDTGSVEQRSNGTSPFHQLGRRQRQDTPRTGPAGPPRRNRTGRATLTMSTSCAADPALQIRLPRIARRAQPRPPRSHRAADRDHDPRSRPATGSPRRSRPPRASAHRRGSGAPPARSQAAHRIQRRGDRR